MSPVFFRDEDYTYRIFSNEEERKHIHIFRGEKEANFWLEPTIEIDHNIGFNSKEIKKTTHILEQYGTLFKQLYSKHICQRVDD